MKKHTAIYQIYKFAHENGLDVKFKEKYPMHGQGKFCVWDSKKNLIMEFISKGIAFKSYRFDFYNVTSFVKDGFHFYLGTEYCDFSYLSKEELVHRMKTCFLNTKNFFNNIQWSYNNELRKLKEKELKRKLEKLESDFNNETDND